MTFLWGVTITLTVLCAVLWLGVWYVLKSFPVPPTMAPFTWNAPRFRQELSQATYLGAFYATATSSIPIAYLPAHVRNGVYYPDGR